MSIAIVEITQQELAAKNINTNNQELIFENLVFAKGPSFSFKCKEPALQYCQQMANKNIKSLLIEVKYGFTIWTQSRQTDNQYLNTREHNATISSLIKAKEQSTSSRKTLGEPQVQVNKVSQKDNRDASKQNALRSLLRRKYRGQYLD